MNIVVWLRSLGLGQYEAAFRDNEIDETVLPNLTAEDLKDTPHPCLSNLAGQRRPGSSTDQRGGKRRSGIAQLTNH